MLSALLVDAILALMLLMLIPVGMFRGGVREVCSATGVLLGLLIAQMWAPRWGDRIADATKVGDNTAQFLAAVGTLLIVTLLVGYGAGAAFTYVPGPGGRIYGGLISFLSGLVFVGAVVSYVQQYLYDGEDHELIDRTYLARGLAEYLDWVLLGIVIALAVATAFGAFVREPETDALPAANQSGTPVQPARTPIARSVTEPVKIEPTVASADQRTASVRIKEVRHWEEPAQTGSERAAKGDWAQTWPTATQKALPNPQGQSEPNPDQEGALLRQWLAEDEPPRNNPPGRRQVDE